MRYLIFVFLPTLLLLACAGAEQKQPEKRWEVKVKTEGEPKVWIWRHDGSRQCDTPAQISPEGVAKDLKRQGVMVYQFRRGNDGMMYPAVCGAGTGATVDLEIARADLVKVQRLGFKVKAVEN